MQLYLMDVTPFLSLDLPWVVIRSLLRACTSGQDDSQTQTFMHHDFEMDTDPNPKLLHWKVVQTCGPKPSPRAGASLVYAEPHLLLCGGKGKG